MTDYQLAALLCSRLSHDLTGPVGAVANGIEMLGDNPDPDMQRQSLELLSFSAAETSRRLQFYRLAFGAAGGVGATLGLGDARQVAMSFFQERKQSLNWPEDDASGVTLPQAGVQLILNMVLLAAEALPRGGTVDLWNILSDGSLRVRVTASGKNAGLHPDFLKALELGVQTGDLDARTVQPYYVALLSDSLNAGLECRVEDSGDVLLMAGIPLP